MGHPWPLFHIFRLFKQQINVKNCPSSIRCWTWTHALLNMSLLPLPLDQGSRPLQRTLIIFDKDQDYLNFRWIVCVSVAEWLLPTQRSAVWIQSSAKLYTEHLFSVHCWKGKKEGKRDLDWAILEKSFTDLFFLASCIECASANYVC